MNEEQITLARRAVACKGWKWLPGMLALPCSFDRTGVRGVHVRVVNVYGSDGLAVWGDISGVQGSWEEWRWREEGRLPDLTDAATLGCLSDLVAEAYADPKKLWSGYVEVHRDQHAVFHLEQAVHDEDGYLVWNCICFGETKAEVLVRALEIAP